MTHFECMCFVVFFLRSFGGCIKIFFRRLGWYRFGWAKSIEKCSVAVFKSGNSYAQYSYGIDMEIAFVKATKSTHKKGRLKRHHNNNIIQCLTSKTKPKNKAKKKTNFSDQANKQVYCEILCLRFRLLCILNRQNPKKNSQLNYRKIDNKILTHGFIY